MPKTPDEIWSDDLLGRRGDARLLIGYIESLSDRDLLRSRGHAYTIAVDANYGIGKSFFLRRLSEEISINHPVAFIDAWTDDLADEPLIAIIATLKTALTPTFRRATHRRKWEDFIEKSGKVVGVTALGLLKRGAGLLITLPAADAVAAILSPTSESERDIIDSKVSDASTGAVDDLADTLRVAPSRLKERIAEFEAGQLAIQDMKLSLAAVIKSLETGNMSPPIVIIVDELDRCRPSYAVELLEVIKHLFDVPGIVFILGVNGDQLSHSIRSAYGEGFDGAAYLKRFISRQYRLSEPDFRQLVTYLLDKCGVSDDHFYAISKSINGRFRNTVTLTDVFCLYAKELDISARELYSLFDILETSIAIAGNNKLLLPYLLPKIVSQIRGSEIKDRDWKNSGVDFILGREETKLNQKLLYNAYDQISRLDNDSLFKVCNTNEGYVYETAFSTTDQSGLGYNALADFRNYDDLVRAVSRFIHNT